MNFIGGLSNKGFSEMVQWFDIRRLSSGLLFGGLSKRVNYSEGCLISEVVQWEKYFQVLEVHQEKALHEVLVERKI